MNTLATNEAIGKAWRTEWQDFGKFRYLNTAAHAAFPKSTVAAVEDALAAKAMPHTMSDSLYFDAPTRVRKALANLLDARPDEIALTTGASTGLQLFALSLKWQVGDEVISAAGEFPTQFIGNDFKETTILLWSERHGGRFIDFDRGEARYPVDQTCFVAIPQKSSESFLDLRAGG